MAETGNAPESKEVGAEPPPFDPASLPPIESITAESDIRGFLQAGVPAELTKAALRRVWTSDPAIRDFIGLAENQWDFTDPTTIPGFGPLEPTDSAAQLVKQAMGDLREAFEPVVGETPSVSVPGDSSLHRSVQVAGVPEQMAQQSDSNSSASAIAPIDPAAPQHDPEGERQNSSQTIPNRLSRGSASSR
jgi:hypothetical protein